MEQDYVSPPRAIRHPVYLIGRNCRGRWVVREQSGQSGGIFAERCDALKFAMFECGRAPQSVVMVPGVLELDLNESPAARNAPQ